MSDRWVISIHLIAKPVCIVHFLFLVLILLGISKSTTSSLWVLDEHQTDPQCQKGKSNKKENNDQVFIISGAGVMSRVGHAAVGRTLHSYKHICWLLSKGKCEWVKPLWELIFKVIISMTGYFLPENWNGSWILQEVGSEATLEGLNIKEDIRGADHSKAYLLWINVSLAYVQPVWGVVSVTLESYLKSGISRLNNAYSISSHLRRSWLDKCTVEVGLSSIQLSHK